MALKSITLGPGDCVTLPKDATISSIIINGSITPTSSCDNLPTPTTYACGVFYFFVDETGTDDSAMEEEHVLYNKITIGTTSYIINELTDGATIGQLNAHVIDTGLFQFTAIQENTSPTERERVAVYFQVPSELFSQTVLQLSDRGTLYNLPPYSATCGEYATPE